ncbi:MAG: S9 family peptidase [Gemmatimonadales bacterium]|nr:MAG: S9 family peptidase [Gemmatimonadales bacterium]
MPSSNMKPPSLRTTKTSARRLLFLLVLGTAFASLGELAAQQQGSDAGDALRPMTFLDLQHFRSAGSPTPSPDGQWLLHTVSNPDWDEAESQTDIHLVSMSHGVSSSRRLTFTEDKNETSPSWGSDGTYFFFLSNRDAPSSSQARNQLYVMRPDGGEARRITHAEHGVSNYSLSPDRQSLVYRSGRSGDLQLYRLPIEGIGDPASDGPGEAAKLTDHPGGVESWDWAPDGERIYFVAPDSVDEGDQRRREYAFTVNIRNQETPLSSLYSLDLESTAVSHLAGDATMSVMRFNTSDDGRWIGFAASSANRYERNITQTGLYSDLYLLDATSGEVERLTETFEVGPNGPHFSPDGRWVAFLAPLVLDRYTMGNRHMYIRAVEDRGGEWRTLGRDFDGHLSIDFWSDDGSTVYFNEGIRATRQLMALDIETDRVDPVTDELASLSVSRDDETGTLLVNYQDPETPSTLFTVSSIDELSDRSRWIQLTDVNPQVREFALGEQSEITWTSSDGVEVGGVLTLPVGYEPGQRYPLIVSIHGGPASADVLNFNGGNASQVYAGAGYVVLRPNYRGSTNYGEAFRKGIVGNYFPPGYEDIMTGVDHLIEEGIVDGDRMGALGWSAGGHWSNWILVNTDRFKAISSGAGTSNWISMYAQSDVQRNRQYYLGDELPYHDFDAYWDQSPLKYIANAATPTMIHVVEGDPRVPSPQSVELHMALVQLGVPTELFLYPGNSHGIPDPRNRYLKAVSEMAWMDYYLRGIGEGFEWDQVLSALGEQIEETTAESEQSDG